MSHMNQTILSNETLNNNPTENDQKIPLIVTFNRTLPDLRRLINRNWHVLQMEPKLKEIFKNPVLLSLKETKISVTLLKVGNFIIIKN